MAWQRKKGIHYIRARQGLLPMHCVHYTNYPFTVHRQADVDSEANKATEGRLWTITHMPSGHNIGRNRRLLKNAKAIVEDLKQWNEFYLVDPNAVLSHETKNAIMVVLDNKHLD